ncbi:MAG TPA: hypothetical protein VNU71_07055 [Burkholderiaceae bacterium]|nr:hypothetical protein [Burkholderiaceae bacterium]
MKVARYGAPGNECPALADGSGRLRDLSDHVRDIVPDTLSEASLAKLAALDVERLPLVADPQARLGPPLNGIGKIICIGLNYTGHAAEAGDVVTLGIDGLGTQRQEMRMERVMARTGRRSPFAHREANGLRRSAATRLRRNVPWT